MVLHEIFGPFIEGSPVSVMFRATLERVLAPQKLNRIFRETAVKQRERDLLFSTCVDLMALVVARIRKTVHTAYQARAEEIPVTLTPLYHKLAGVETVVSERLVRDTAADWVQVRDELPAPRPEVLSGYDVRILDGNYLAGTQHRLKELRTWGAAAWPGMSVCVLDPQRELIAAVVLHEDGHANERALIERIWDQVAAGQCWVGDRNFCTFPLMFGLKDRDASFIVRQHGQVVGEPVGPRKYQGRSEGGTVYEQKLKLTNDQGKTLEVRRITIELDQPNRFDETEIHLLSNLPPSVTALQIAGTYRQRWSIEAAFMHLATVFNSEIDTLGYPPAALLGFCVGVLLYNVLSVIQAALRAAQPEPTQGRRLSPYYLADEISGVYRGLLIAVPPGYWTEAFADLPVDEFADCLLHLARKVKLTRFFTNPRSRKSPPPERKRSVRGNHVSTHKILLERSGASP